MAMASVATGFPPPSSSVLVLPTVTAPTITNPLVKLSLQKGLGCCRRNCKTLTQGVQRFTVQASRDTANTITVTSPDQSEAVSRKNIDYQIVKITTNTSSLRGCSIERLKFEVEYGLKRGTTDNSYIITGADVALIDVPDENFKDLFLETLEQTIDLKTLKHVVIGHISPKRVKNLTNLLEQLDDKGLRVQVHCSNPAAQLLSSLLPESLTEKTIKLRSVRSGDYLDLGKGHKLEFILTPTPRWPDGMCTYDPETQLLFTHKLFSSHVCSSNHFDLGGWDVYGEDWRYFYDCMLSPVPRQAGAALDRLPIVSQFAKPSYSGKTGIDIIKADVRYILSTVFTALNLPINKAAGFAKEQKSEGLLVTAALCPIHGPVVRSTITELVREYRLWTKERLKQVEDATIAVIYASAYGNTAALAQAISRGISKSGVGVESLNAEQSTAAEVSALVQRCCGFVVGSPTLGGHMPTPVQDALGVILRDNNARSKPCGVFGSFGWSGEAVDEIEQRLKDAGFSFAFPTIRCKFKPTESMLQVCEESGTDLAQTVKQTKLKARSKASPQFLTASDIEQAVGRVVGSLCVVSAKEGDAESAMLASWVSQASFVPPGLTIAVAKDRAVESLLLPGGKFVLNVLANDEAGQGLRSLSEPLVNSMAVGAVFKDYTGRINSLDFHRTEDLLVTASDDESICLYDTANASLVKMVHSRKYGVSQICFTHHTSAVLYASKNDWDDSLRYLSLYDNRYLRYFKGHNDRVLSLCMSPKNDCFMSGSLDHTVRLWDLRENACQGLLRVRGRPAVAYDQQGLVFAVAMEGGAIKLFDARSYDKGPFDTFLVGGDTAEVSGMKFSNDGKMMLLSTTSSHVYVLDAYSGKKLHGFTLEANPEGGTFEASFSPDGQFVVSGSGDGSLRVWSTVSGNQVACWLNHAGIPAVVKWAPRRVMFASASVVLAFWLPDSTKLSHLGESNHVTAIDEAPG